MNELHIYLGKAKRATFRAKIYIRIATIFASGFTFFYRLLQTDLRRSGEHLGEVDELTEKIRNG